MRTPSRLPRALVGRPFSVERARALGVTDDRLRAGDLVAPFHGVRASVVPATVRERCAAYLPRMTGAQVFSHTTAAAIHGIPLPRRLERDPRLHVTVVAPVHPPQARGVVGHRSLEPVATVSRRGLRVVSPVLAWCQIASSLDHVDLVVAGDFLVRRKAPLATIEELRDAVAAFRGRGTRALRLALAAVRQGTDSPMESRLRLILTAAGLPEPVIGHTVTFPNGDFVGTPDLAYVRERIAIEYEGEHHRADPRVYADDIARREVFEQVGWLPLLVIKDHLAFPQQIVRRVEQALAERAR